MTDPLGDFAVDAMALEGCAVSIDADEITHAVVTATQADGDGVIRLDEVFELAATHGVGVEAVEADFQAGEVRVEVTG